MTGEVSAADAAAIDGMLAEAARSLGAEDPRTEQQRRSDLFADLLLGRLRLHQPNQDEEQTDDVDWLEVEDIDPDTGELLGSHLQRLDGDGEPIGEPVDAAAAQLKTVQTAGSPKASSAAPDWGRGAARQPPWRQ